MSELIDELMEGLNVNSSNDTAKKEIKDFKKAVIKSIDKFLSYIKQETKKKGIEKIDIEKKDAEKEHIKNINDKYSLEDTNNKPATSDNIKVHTKDKQKRIKQIFLRFFLNKVY